MMQIQTAPRSASMPPRPENNIRKKSEGNTRKKHHSMTFRERLRTTFLRKVKKTAKCREDINYGKIVILGDQAVGKTSLIHRFSNNYFTEQYTPTETTAMFDVTALVECDTEIKEPKSAESLRKAAILNSHVTNTKKQNKRALSRVISMGDASIQTTDITQHLTGVKSFKFQLVDTTADITKSVPVTYRATVADAHGFLLICSYDKPDSIKYIQSVYEDIKKMRQNNNVPTIIVANKCDLSSEDSVEFENSVAEMAANFNIEWCEISAANSEGYQNMMELVLNEMNVFDEAEERERNLPDDYAFIEESKRYKNHRNRIF